MHDTVYIGQINYQPDNGGIYSIGYRPIMKLLHELQFENDMFCKGSERREKVIGHGHQLGKKNPYYATPNTKFTHINN